MSARHYEVEANQTDPADSPTPGLSHFAGMVGEFATADAARLAGIAILGQRADELGDGFAPCCDWQSPETVITSFTVYAYSDGRGQPRATFGGRLRKEGAA